VDCDGFEVETLLNIRALQSKLAVFEVPSFEGSRLHGVSNLHAFRDGRRVLRTILSEFVLGGSHSPAPAAPEPVTPISFADAALGHLAAVEVPESA
jgi:hypothetical protein